MPNPQHSTSSSALVKTTASVMTIAPTSHQPTHTRHDRAVQNVELKSTHWRSILTQKNAPVLSQIETASFRIARTAANISIATTGKVLSSVGTTCLSAGEYCQDKQKQRP
jgi:hypothetical protein